MKRCPECRRDYYDDTLLYCLDDGNALLEGPASADEPATAILSDVEIPTGRAKTALFRNSGDRPHVSPHSIAVLPFVNVSADAENEYFCDGLAEDLLNALAKTDQLKVAARTSSFSFKGKNAQIDEIGQKLGVANVLEGSVRRSGDRIRVTAQLINTSDGYHLWSESYDRKLRDVFDIQDEISLAIVEALKVNLLGDAKEQFLKRYTENHEAYQLYLQGRYQFFKLTPAGFQRSIQLFEQAIETEPDYALAFAGLGLTLSSLTGFGVIPPAVGIPKINAAVSRALEIDDSLAEAHFAFAMAKFHNERNWPEAERGFKRAIDLNPGYAFARVQYGMLLAFLGRDEEAIEQGERALELDPVGLVTIQDVGIIYWCSGQYERVQILGHRLLELEEKVFGGHMLLTLAAWAEKDLGGALEIVEGATALGSQWASTMAACLYGLMGEREKAESMLNEMLERSSSGYFPAVQIAMVYAGLGDRDQAFEWLERALERNENIFFKFLSTLLPDVGDDPRFHDILRRVGLAQ